MKNFIGQRVGNYQLIRLLGRGGFADVYLGEHIHLKKKAALKLIHDGLDSSLVESFTKEAQIVAALKHPHIVRILEFGFEHQQPFFVMEHAPNGTLRERHPRGSHVPLPTIVSYVKQVSSALAYIHANKLIHRDVKPENMLIDEDGNVLLSDFGIVTIAHSTTSMEPQVGSGTVHYMAPEQIKGLPRPASDQYSLAIVVYEWISGTRPFSGSSYVEVAMNHLSEPFPPLHEKIPTLPPQVEQVVHKALSKDPQQRFPTIQDFSTALEEACLSPTLSNFGMAVASTIQPETTFIQHQQTELKAAPSPLYQTPDGTYKSVEQILAPSSQASMQENISTDAPTQAEPNGLFKQFGRKKLPVLISLALVICLVGTGIWLFPLLTSHANQGYISPLQGGSAPTHSVTPSPNTQITPTPTAQLTPTTHLTLTTQATPTTQPTQAILPSAPTTQPTPTAQPTPAHQTIVDNLDDWSKAYSHTPNLKFDPNNSQYFNGDTSLVSRTAKTHEAIVWHLPQMKSFQAIVYFWPGEAISPFSIYTSSDDQHWVAQTPVITGQSGNWERYVYTLNNLSNVNFVQLQWNNMNGQTWTPQVSSVTFSS